jgi:hypothetical protein
MANTKTDFTALRGLAARIAWASCDHTQHVADRFDLESSVCMVAVDQGFRDFRAGRCVRDMPPLLADVQDLADAWLSGWRFGEALDLTMECSGAAEC